MLGTVLVHLSLACYTAAVAVYLVWLLRPSDRLVTAGRLLLGAGLLGHLGAFASALVVSPDLMPWRGGQLFSLLAAATVLLYLIFDLRYRVPVAGAFVAPLTVAAMVPAHFAQTTAQPHGVLTRSLLLSVHVGSATLGSGALLLAFALALLYLAGERQLKRKRPGRLFSRLPSLDLIDRLGWLLSVWGFVLLSVVIVTGSFVTHVVFGGYLHLDPKSGFALLAWALLAAAIQARLVAGWRGRRLAILVVVGFMLLVCSYAGLLATAPLGVGGRAAQLSPVKSGVLAVNAALPGSEG